MQIENRPGLKTVDQFCADHGLSRSTFYRLVRDSAIKVVKVNAATRIKPEHEKEWLDSLPVVSGAAA